MTFTAKELRFNVSMLFDVLEKGDSVLITYRGKTKAKLVPFEDEPLDKTPDKLFGLWKEREMDVEKTVREMRKGRDFGL
jgi:antitoxin (DNA-binding transcriptional repressor) of toxin-antitoxin stability system